VRVTLDAQLIGRGATYRSAGVSGYSLALLRALGRLQHSGETAHEFVAFVNDGALHVPGVHNPLARIGWEQTALPVHLLAQGADLVHGLVNVLPLAARGPAPLAVPGVVTVHDLSFVRLPEVLPPAKRAYLTALCRASARQARRVIAVSTQTADDLMNAFALPASRIVVVPNGVGAEFCPATAEAAEAFRRRMGLPERYLLYLGTLEPRKNLEALIAAYARWRRSARGDDDVALVIAGGKGWYFDTIFAAVREAGVEAQVHFPGFLPAAELPDWYRSALGFVYPSRLEGFGLPVLEAMASGTPVITSSTPALLEVGGDAVLAAPADDIDALADAIRLLMGQPALRAELSARGLRRAEGYSWARTARETLAVYEEAARAS
jgi:glycosyltransferase involved in cell wall biosynthesis